MRSWPERIKTSQNEPAQSGHPSRLGDDNDNDNAVQQKHNIKGYNENAAVNLTNIALKVMQALGTVRRDEQGPFRHF